MLNLNKPLSKYCTKIKLELFSFQVIKPNAICSTLIHLEFRVILTE